MSADRRSFTFVTATLLLALLSPLSLTAGPMLPVQAQVTAQQNREAEAERLLQVARNSLKTGDAQKASEPALQALEIARASKQREIEGQATAILARAYIELGRDREAAEYAQQAIVIAREIKNRELEGFALAWQAIASFYGEDDKAMNLAQQAITIAREIQNREIEAWALFALANVQEPQQALNSAQKAAELARQIQNREVEAWANVGMAYVYSQKMDDYQKAFNSAQQALKIAQAIKHRSLQGYALVYQAFASAYSNNHQATVESTQKAAVIGKELKNQQIAALALIALTTSHVKGGQHQKAIDTAQGAATLVRELKKVNYEVAALRLLLNSSSKLKDYQKAIAPAQRWLEIAREQKNRENEGLGLLWLTTAYAGVKDYPKAIESAQQLIAIAQEQQNREYEAAGLLLLVASYTELEDYQKAIEPAQRLLATAREQKKRETEVTALSFLARAYAKSGNSQMANTSVQQGEAIAQALPDVKAKASALIQIRYAYEVLGNSQKADQLANQALVIARQNNDADLMWEVVSPLVASRLRQSGDFKETTDLLEDYLAVLRQEKEVDFKKFSGVLGFYFILQDHQKIQEIANYLLTNARKQNKPEQEFVALVFLALDYSWMGNREKVREILDSELSKFSKSPDPNYRTAAAIYSFIIANSNQDHQKAVESIEQVIELIPKIVKGDSAEQRAALLVEIFQIVSAPSYAKANGDREAISRLKRGLSFIDKWSTVAGEKEKDSLSILKGSSLVYLAEIYSRSNEPQKAISLYQDALSIPEFAAYDASQTSKNSFDLRIVSYAGLGRVYQKLNRPVTAVTYYKQAVNQLEQRRNIYASNLLNLIPGQVSDLASLNLRNLSQSWFFKSSFGDIGERKNSDVYRELAELLLSQGRIAEAQQVLELLKAQELNDFARGTRSNYQLSEVEFNQTEKQIKEKHGSLITFGQKLEECEQTKCTQLKQLNDQLDALTQAFNQQIETIESQVVDNRVAGVSAGTQDFIASAEKIVTAQPNTVLIYPLVLKDKVRLLWASRGGVLKSEVCNVGETQLWQQISEFRDRLKTPSSDMTALKASGQKLYDCLIKPLEPELQKNNIQNLVFVPDRGTNYIPMAALFDGEKFLIERYTISSVLSAGLTDVSDRLPTDPKSTPVLALGLSNAIQGFNPLPNVPLEIDTIVRKDSADSKGIYPGLEFLNQAFSLDALRNNLQDRKILHIATHGAFVPADPKASYLVLGTGEKYPIYQIQYLRNLQNVHLVVLSACETALGGSDSNGIEIAGISSYFLRDKAKAVMASLWLVNDTSTSQLMQQFYNNLAQGTAQKPVTKAEALRQAQLALLQGKVTAKYTQLRSDLTPQLNSEIVSTRSPAANFSHPYYWAPFILIGNSL